MRRGGRAFSETSSFNLPVEGLPNASLYAPPRPRKYAADAHDDDSYDDDFDNDDSYDDDSYDDDFDDDDDDTKMVGHAWYLPFFVLQRIFSL